LKKTRLLRQQINKINKNPERAVGVSCRPAPTRFFFFWGKRKERGKWGKGGEKQGKQKKKQKDQKGKNDSPRDGEVVFREFKEKRGGKV